MHRDRSRGNWLVIALILAAIGAGPPGNAAIVLVNNTDSPNVGLNDPTPRSPVGGNNGTTLGAQRLNAIQYAAGFWGSLLQSNVTIVVDTSFGPLQCDPTSGVLGGATALEVIANFSGAPRTDTWYPVGLAGALSGSDLRPNTADIFAIFNTEVDAGASCLGGKGFYYGLDNNPGASIDFLNVVMHELAHGLGFQSFVNGQTGALLAGLPSIYEVFIRDLDQNQTWAEMTTDAMRAASVVNAGKVVWDGANVTANVNIFAAGTGPSGRLLLFTPTLFQNGSSISHWDLTLQPDALMEPALSPSVQAGTSVDVTACQLQDIGWALTNPANCSAQLQPLPIVNVAPTSLDFGSVAVGSSFMQTVQVTNSGPGELSLNTVGGTDPVSIPFQLLQDSCSDQVLNLGEQCTIDIDFRPTADGTFTDSLDITSNDPSKPVVLINLRGDTFPPAIVVNPANVDFGNVTLTATADRDIAVANTGTSDLEIGMVASGKGAMAPFSIVQDDCSGKTLGATEECTIVARFAPTTVNLFNDSFDVPSNDPSTPMVQVALTGATAAAWAQSSGSGGCALAPARGFDPLFPVLVLLALIQVCSAACRRTPGEPHKWFVAMKSMKRLGCQPKPRRYNSR